MEKTGMRGRAGALLAAGALAASMCAPAAAMAATPTASGSGVRADAQSFDSGSSAWDPAANDGATGGGGQIQLSYSTVGGQWTSDGTNYHDNGTYVLTVPKLIKYENMNIGAVDTSDSCTVKVAGAIASGKKVAVTATPGSVTNGDDNTAIAATVERDKAEWSADEAYGTLSEGKISGTSATDTVKLSGEVKSAGTWKGVVTYTSEIK